jgi:hypothetical protein
MNNYISLRISKTKIDQLANTALNLGAISGTKIHRRMTIDGVDLVSPSRDVVLLQEMLNGLRLSFVELLVLALTF